MRKALTWLPREMRVRRRQDEHRRDLRVRYGRVDISRGREGKASGEGLDPAFAARGGVPDLDPVSEINQALRVWIAGRP